MPERYSDRMEHENQRPPTRRRAAIIAASAVTLLAAGIFVPRVLEKDDRVIGAPSSTEIPSNISGPPSLNTPSQKDHVPNMSVKVGDKITVCDATFVDSQQTSEGRHVNQAISRPIINADGDPYFQVHGDNSGKLTLQGVVAGPYDYWLDYKGQKVRRPHCAEQTYQGVILGNSSGPFATTNHEVFQKGSDHNLMPDKVCALGGFAMFQNVHDATQAKAVATTCS